MMHQQIEYTKIWRLFWKYVSTDIFVYTCQFVCLFVFLLLETFVFFAYINYTFIYIYIFLEIFNSQYTYMKLFCHAYAVNK